MRFQGSVIGLVLWSGRLAQQPIAEDRAHVRAVCLEHAGFSKKADIRSVGGENVPTIDEREILTLRPEQMLRFHETEV